MRGRPQSRPQSPHTPSRGKRGISLSIGRTNESSVSLTRTTTPKVAAFSTPTSSQHNRKLSERVVIYNMDRAQWQQRQQRQSIEVLKPPQEKSPNPATIQFVRKTPEDKENIFDVEGCRMTLGDQFSRMRVVHKREKGRNREIRRRIADIESRINSLLAGTR